MNFGQEGSDPVVASEESRVEQSGSGVNVASAVTEIHPEENLFPPS